MRVYDLAKLPFGSRVTVKALNGDIEKAVIVTNAVAFIDGILVEFEDMLKMEVYLGWL